MRVWTRVRARRWRLVCAPAGYGKTLLLADWSRTSTGVDTAWVGVDRDDNDPRRLWAAVVAAIAGCPSVPQSSRLHGRWAWRAGAQPEFLAELAEAVQALPQPLRLILDDVHELVDPDALHGVQILTRIKPASLQLVLSSRLDPPLSLPRLRLQGRLRELRAAQLAFTPAQAAQLLERSGLRLSPQQVEVLHRRTGGWVAGLRLAARAVAESADREAFLTHFSGDDRSVADYLVGEILSGLPQAAQEFLRVISICDPVPIGLAAALSEREEAGSVLDRLEHETSLVVDDGTGARGLPGPGAAAHVPARRPAAPGPAAGGRAARGGRPLVGRSGRAGTRPRARRRRPRPGPADRAAAPLRHPADPRRAPRAAAPGAGQGRRLRHRDRPFGLRQRRTQVNAARA